MLEIIGLALWILIGFGGWKVYSRAGFSGSLGLLFLVPIANFFALLYLAYADWPISKSHKP